MRADELYFGARELSSTMWALAHCGFREGMEGDLYFLCKERAKCYLKQFFESVDAGEKYKNTERVFLSQNCSMTLW